MITLHPTGLLSEPYDFSVPANMVGGAAFVHVHLVYWTSWDNCRDLVAVRIDLRD